MIRFVSRAFAALAAALALALGALVIGVFHIQKDLPDYRGLARYEPAVTTRVYSGDGRLMAEYASEKRFFLPFDAIPKLVVDAVLSAEDKTFFTHPGVDIPGVVNALITNLSNYGANRRPVGASTITQQVAKNFLVGNEMSVERKVKEAILAFRIEQAYSKERILELYLNEIYLGNGSYGVAAAALNYFDKSLDQLSVAEAALIAGLPKAPNNYDPIRQPAAAKARRDWVIGRMLEDGQITSAQAEEARAEPISVKPRQVVAPVEADYFAEEVRRELARRYGEAALYKGGLNVYSTLDPRLQTIADRVLREALERYDRGRGWVGPVAQIDVKGKSGGAGWREQLAAIVPPPGYEPFRLAVVLQGGDGQKIGFADGSTVTLSAAEQRWARRRPAVGDVIGVERLSNVSYALRQPPRLEGALVALDPFTGRVLAMSGGFSYKRSQFNRATQALRQPGSTFKPFVYLAALEEGYTPASVINDSRFVASGGRGNRLYVPMNASGRYYGPTTLRVGLEQSRNVVAVKLADAVGMDKVADAAQRFGVVDRMPQHLAGALGAVETTLLRLTTGYAMFVNGGQQVAPTVIDRIQDRYGRIVYRHDPRICVGCSSPVWSEEITPEVLDDRPPVTDPASAYQIVAMLQGVVDRGTAKVVREVGRPVAGKTGTSDEAKDVWFVGFTPNLVVGVFLGYDEPHSLGDSAAGGTLAAPVFKNFIKEALADEPPTPFRVPSDVRLVRVDARSGRPSSVSNPNAILEAFKPGTTPGSPGAGATAQRGSGGGSAAPRYTAGPTTGTGGLY